MAMTAQVKAELASTQITKTCCRKAEVASMLRFAGGLHIVSGRIVVEAELDTGAAARRLRNDIAEVFGHPSDVVMVQGNGIRKGSRYIVRVTKDGEALARQTGLLDQRGRPSEASRRPSSAAAAATRWPRGEGRSWPTARSPSPDARPRSRSPAPAPRPRSRSSASPDASASRRRRARCAGSTASSSATATPSAPLLTRLGAHESLMAWEERRMRREVRATANRLANFDDANLRRSARAAVAAGARVERALEILGEEIPDHLAPGRPPAARAQAGLAGGARAAARPGADQGRDRRPDPPPARHGGQARGGPRHPRHRGRR